MTPKIPTRSLQKLPIHRTQNAKWAIFLTGLGVFAFAARKGIETYLESIKTKIKTVAAKDLETQKSQDRINEMQKEADIRREEENQKHQYDMELEKERHKNKMEEAQAKGSRAAASNLPEGEVSTDQEPLPTQNVGELVNSPIDEKARIKYLGNSFVQNRDILLLFGPPGTGKSHLIVDCLSIITGGDSGRTIIPLKDKINLHYKAIYYDKEPDDTEWQEKFGGRKDLYGISRVPCRDLNEKDVLNDIRAQLRCNPEMNYVFVIDPLSNFDIKRNENHPFFDEMARIQEDEIKNERNVTFILVGHAIKDPKGKGLSDIGGSKQWGESVKTVVSFMPTGKDDGLLRLTFEKSKNGKEVTRGTSFILKPEKTPHLHFKCNDGVNQKSAKEGTIFAPMPVKGGLNVKRPKRRGKLAKVTDEDAATMSYLYEVKKMSLKYISDNIGKKYDLKPQEVKRLIDDMRNVRA